MTARRALAALSRFGIALALLAEIAFFAARSEHFLTLENLENVLRQNVAVAVIAAGMTFVILTGGIDLSVGSLVGLTGVVCAELLTGEWAPPPVRIALGCAAGVGAGAACGALSGAVSTRMRIPPFVATLAMLTVARGAALLWTDSRTITGLPEAFAGFGATAWPVAVMLAVYVAGWVSLTRTRFGRHVYAVGGNAEAARLCGIRVERVLVLVYALSGALAGLSGVLMDARLGTGYPKGGELFELDAIAAVVVGGTSLQGGRGSIWGTLFGALVIGVLTNGLNLIHVETYSQKIVVGVVLVLAAWLDRFRAP